MGTFIKPAPREVKPLDEVVLTPATRNQIASLMETFGTRVTRPTGEKAGKGMSDREYRNFLRSEEKAARARARTVIMEDDES